MNKLCIDTVIRLGSVPSPSGKLEGVECLIVLSQLKLETSQPLNDTWIKVITYFSKKVKSFIQQLNKISLKDLTSFLVNTLTAAQPPPSNSLNKYNSQKGYLIAFFCRY